MPDRTFVCPHCKQPATARTGGEIGWNGLNEDDEWVAEPTVWTLLQCERCEAPTLIEKEYFGGGAEEVESTIYPAPRRANPAIPGPLRLEWEEAQRCLNAHAYAACLVMVRRTLEGACLDLGVKKKTNLASGLKELERKGLLDGTLVQWANALRLSGNQGAHFTGKPVPRDTAVDALDFIEALLDHIYVFRKRFEDFKKRIGS